MDEALLAALGIALGVAALAAATGKIFYDRWRSGLDNGDVLGETHEICRDLKAMLNDVNLSDGSEERYEVDLSLRSYFGDNRQKIQRVAEKLRGARTGVLHKRDEKMNAFGEFLEWTVNEFYRYDYEEEERIRIWSQNIPEFHSKMTKTLAMRR